MITNVSLVSVWVKDQDAALAFYTDVLGFQLGDDVRLGEDFRWLTVVHPNQPELHLHLTTPGPPLSEELQDQIRRSLDAGAMPGVGLNVDDCRATCAELAAKGVTVLQEPAERPYGVEALIRDNSGNWIVLVEPREFDPATMTLADLDAAGG
jgi:catechol 2,3-dioxygenase-like lactoylglutathione lyase family enzyme